MGRTYADSGLTMVRRVRRGSTTGAIRQPDTRWFQDRIKASPYGSQRRLADALGIDYAALSLALRGKRHLRLQEAATLAKFLHLPFLTVVRRLGVKI